MNILAHVFASAAIAAYATGNPFLLLVALFFGILPDLDHLTHLRKAIKTKRFGPQSRSWLHELLGFSVLSLIIISLSYFYTGVFYFMFFPLLVHYLLDFLTRPTRPFHPISDKIVFLGIYPTSLRRMVVADAIVTVVLGALLCVLLIM